MLPESKKSYTCLVVGSGVANVTFLFCRRDSGKKGFENWTEREQLRHEHRLRWSHVQRRESGFLFGSDWLDATLRRTVAPWVSAYTCTGGSGGCANPTCKTNTDCGTGSTCTSPAPKTGSCTAPAESCWTASDCTGINGATCGSVKVAHARLQAVRPIRIVAVVRAQEPLRDFATTGQEQILPNVGPIRIGLRANTPRA